MPEYLVLLHGSFPAEWVDLEDSVRGWASAQLQQDTDLVVTSCPARDQLMREIRDTPRDALVVFLGGAGSAGTADDQTAWSALSDLATRVVSIDRTARVAAAVDARGSDGRWRGSRLYRTVRVRRGDHSSVAVSTIGELLLIQAALDRWLDGRSDLERAAFGQLEIGVTVIDREYRVWYQDAVHRRITGGFPHLGRVCWHTYHGSQRQRRACTDCAVAEALTRGSYAEQRYLVSAVGSRLRYFQVSAGPLPGATEAGHPVSDPVSGEVLAAWEWAADITESAQIHLMPARERLPLVLKGIQTRGFRKARAYSATQDGTALVGQCAIGADIKGFPGLRLEIAKDPYCARTVLGKCARCYSGRELGDETYRERLQKNDVAWWTEYPFYGTRGVCTGLLAFDCVGDERLPMPRRGSDELGRHISEFHVFADEVEAIVEEEARREAEESMNQQLGELLRLGCAAAGAAVARLWDVRPASEGLEMALRLAAGEGRRPGFLRGAAKPLYEDRCGYRAARVDGGLVLLDTPRAFTNFGICGFSPPPEVTRAVTPLLNQDRELAGLLELEWDERRRFATAQGAERHIHERAGRFFEPMVAALSSAAALRTVGPRSQRTFHIGLDVLFEQKRRQRISFDHLLGTLAAQAAQTVGADVAYFRVLEGDGLVLRRVGRGYGNCRTKESISVLDRWYHSAQCIRERRPILLDRLGRASGGAHEDAALLRVDPKLPRAAQVRLRARRAYVALPLSYHGSLLGSLTAFSTKRAGLFRSGEALEILAAAADRAAGLLHDEGARERERQEIDMNDTLHAGFVHQAVGRALHARTVLRTTRPDATGTRRQRAMQEADAYLALLENSILAFKHHGVRSPRELAGQLARRDSVSLRRVVGNVLQALECRPANGDPSDDQWDHEVNQRKHIIVTNAIPQEIAFQDELCAIYTVLDNLIKNALESFISFDPPTVPRVHVSAALVGGSVEVRVTDNGVGIHPQQRARVFTPGWSGKKASPGGQHGKGMGLYLSRLFTAALRGSLVVEDSKPRKGTTILLCLNPNQRSGDSDG